MFTRIDLSGPWQATRRSPMLRLTASFIAGILVAWGVRPAAQQLWILLVVITPIVLLVLALRSTPRKRWHRGIALMSWFFVFGMFWQMQRLPMSDPLDISHMPVHAGSWAVMVDAVNGTTEKVVRADAQLLARSDRDAFIPMHGKVMLTLMRGVDDVALRAGDRVWIDAALEPITRVPDPGGFDRKGWAASRGIEREAFVRNGDWHVIDHPWRWTDLFTGMRERVSAWLDDSGVPFRERALVKALILGERDELDSEQKDAFARSGTIHVLAVSGMHVGLIFAVLTFALGWWGHGGRARWMRGMIILLVLWGYAGITGASPSVLRATVMFSFFTIASVARQRTDHLNSLFAAALLLLVWDPAMLQQAGFLLSFLAVLGIIMFYRPMLLFWTPKTWAIRQVWSLAVVSIAAQLLTTPLSLFMFKAFPVWFLPANIVVVTVSGFAVYGAIALIALYKVPLIGVAVSWVMTLLLRVVGLSTDFFAALPGAYPAVRIGVAEMVLMYVLVLACAAWWQWKWRGMKWVSGATFAATMLLCGLRAQKTNVSAELVVYDVRDGFLAGMVHGRDLVVLASADSLVKEHYATIKFDRHARARGLNTLLTAQPWLLGEDTATDHGATVFTPGRWRSPEFDVAFVHDGRLVSRSDSGRFDVTVLHDMRYIDAEELQRLAGETRAIVVAGGVPWNTRRRISTWCAEHDLACHDVRVKGAYVLQR